VSSYGCSRSRVRKGNLANGIDKFCLTPTSLTKDFLYKASLFGKSMEQKLWKT